MSSLRRRENQFVQAAVENPICSSGGHSISNQPFKVRKVSTGEEGFTVPEHFTAINDLKQKQNITFHLNFLFRLLRKEKYPTGDFKLYPLPTWTLGSYCHISSGNNCAQHDARHLYTIYAAFNNPKMYSGCCEHYLVVYYPSGSFPRSEGYNKQSKPQPGWGQNLE